MAGPVTRLEDALVRSRLLPLAVPASADEARRLVDGLDGGVLEIALRRDEALEALAAVTGRADVLVGAGTVRTVDQVDRVADAGAAFVVTPGFRPEIVERCLELGLDVLPGVATAGEVMGALGLGVDTVKLFPAEVLGGVALVAALAGPFPDVRMVPSGGVTAERAAAYLELPTVLAVSRSLA
jgi:2-dehydro-3-deoxyphosphogluconate aldolase/(4S)-4-hydroxy-2-oxoglutarate aldolase